MKVIPKALLKKHAKVKRMPKSNKRMKRHFDGGGDVDSPQLPEFDPSQMDNPAPTLGPVNYDDLSFGKAFALARKMGDTTFKWRGGSYGTQLAKPGQSTSPSVAAANKAIARHGTAAAQDIPEVTSTARRFDQPSLTEKDAMGRYKDPDFQNYVERRMGNPNPRQWTDADRANLTAMGQQALANQIKAQNRSFTDADQNALIQQAIQNAKNVPRQKPGYMYGSPNMKKGGRVAKYAKGGHIGSKRGDGLAQKGKTKGRVR